jgi:predicted NBD/HSP70 family sugar kinase
LRQIQTKKAVRQHNQKAVLALIRTLSPTTILETAGKIHLSTNTVTKIIEHYTNQELIINSGKGESTYEGGKRPNLYAFNPKARFAIGMQIAHEGQLHAVLTDLNGSIVHEISLPIKWNTKMEIILDRILSAYEQLIEAAKVDRNKIVGLAIGTHGITDYEHGTIIVSPHNPVWGKNIAFKKMVEDRIPDRIPIFVDNQIRFKAFAEKSLGVAKEFDNIIILHSGISAIAGIVSDNLIKRGKHYLAGAIGHMTLDPDDEEVCMCGARGCFGVLIDMNRVLRKAKDRAKENPASLIFQSKKADEIGIEDVFRASNRGDALARELMDEVIKWFAAGIHNAILFYDPEIVIIQGVYAEAGDYFIEMLRGKVQEVSLLQVPLDLKIEYSRLGNKVGAIGAAAFTIQEFFE